MSNFTCPKCGTACIDTPSGYVAGCRHRSPDAKPTVSQLIGFTGAEYGSRSPEHGFTQRLGLLAMGIGPDLLPEEVMLLMLLVETWRSHLADGGEA